MPRSTGSGFGILILAFIGVYHYVIHRIFTSPYKKQIEEGEKRYKELSRYRSKLLSEKSEIASKYAELEKVKESIAHERDSLIKLLSEKAKAIPWLATAWAEYEYTLNIETAKYLLNKKHPAFSTAEIKKEAARKQRESDFRAKFAEYKLEYLIDIYPWLLDEFEEDKSEILTHEKVNDEIIDSDRVLMFLDRQEYLSLTTTERNQRALDKYVKRNKSKREIGREYERYIGYKYEAQGWKVIFHGIIKEFEDMGRDIIARKGNNIHIIQCKCWSASKVIREKHVFQLFGTSLEYAMQNNIQLNLLHNGNNILPIKPVLATTTSLSDIAKTAASILGVTIKEEKLPDSWPRIKCNVSKINGEKIYHLPFDQQYDKIAIEPDKGEFYAHDVFEAETSGFRRAYRWHGS